MNNVFNSDIVQSYYNEIREYPLLSAEEEVYYGKMLTDPENKQLLLLKLVKGFLVSNLNISLLFYSLCNNSSYKTIIDNLLSFYCQLHSNNDEDIDKLSKYKRESNKLNRPLNENELNSIFNITNDGMSILSEIDLLNELKEFMNYKLAYDKLFISNLRLVFDIAAKQSISNLGNGNRSMDMIDLISEGNFGLMRAIDKFDVRLGYRLSTYATPCILRAVKEAISKDTLIKSSYSARINLRQYKYNVDNIEQEEGRKLSPEEIAVKLSIPIELVRECEALLLPVLSLESNRNAEDDNSSLQYIIASDDNVEEEALGDDTEEDVKLLLESLNDKEKKIVKMYFGLDEYNGKSYSFRDMSKMMPVTAQRIYQIEKRALFKMKRQYKKMKKSREY